MKRFYREVSVEPAAGGFRVLLDGRAIKTPLGAPQIVPTRPLADALAREWDAQGEQIDPASLPLRDLADYAIDIVAPERARVIDGLLRFAETDTLCYRADPEDALFARQQALWEPLLAAMEARHGLRFERVSGIIHRPQPAATLARFRSLLEAMDAYSLAAANTLASLAVSLTIALAALEDGADAESLWSAANLEEDWQAELWGRDSIAEQRRAFRMGEFVRAADFARLTLSGEAS